MNGFMECSSRFVPQRFKVMPASIAAYVPQFVNDEEALHERRRARTAWVASVAGAALFLGVIALAPLALARGYERLGWVIYRGFSVACHQIPERSFHLFGFPLAVCARCFGLYVGGIIGVLLYPLFARPLGRQREAPGRVWLIAAALPTTVDFALGFFHIWPNTHLSRFLTASLLGAVAAFFIMPVVLEFSRRRRYSSGSLQTRLTSASSPKVARNSSEIA